MALTPLPTAPSRADPANFAARADTMMAALPVMVTEINTALPVIESAESHGDQAVTAAAQAAASAAAAASSAALAEAVAGGSTGAYPAARPALLLDFANAAALDPRITFSRASTATVCNAKGLLETVAANMPRFERDPLTGACLGLLVEPQRTNLLTYSAQADQAAWVKVRTTVTANATSSPDGAVNADKLVEDTSTGTHYAYASAFSYTSGTEYTLSIYAKAAERTVFNMFFPSSAFTANLTATFDLVTGTRTSGTATQYSCTAVGDGWFRCSITATATATATGNTVLVSLQTAAGYTGDGTSGLYIWGAQLEAGGFLTSYIPTTSASATRSADAASMAGASFSSWFSPTRGTLVLHADTAYIGATGSDWVRISDGTTNNILRMSRSGVGATPQWLVAVSGATQAAPSLGNIAANTPFAMAGAYETNSFAMALNGAVSATDESGSLPVVDRMLIGVSDIAARIRRLAYYPLRLNAVELQALTTA